MKNYSNSSQKIPHVLFLFCSNRYKNVQLATCKPQIDLSHGTGTKAKPEQDMTLIYRGQKYVQNKVAAKKQHNELTYRGKAYTS